MRCAGLFLACALALTHASAAKAQTSEAPLAAPGEAAKPSEAAKPNDASSAPAQAIKAPEPASAAQAAPATPAWYEAIRPEFILLSTGRYQGNDGNHTTLSENGGAWDPTGRKFGDLVTTVGGSLSYQKWVVATRLDLIQYFHAPKAATPTFPSIRDKLKARYRNQVQLEYISASYSGRHVELTLGDFYATLGRGMVLAIRKVGDVGIDNKLRGADIKLNAKGASLRAFGGFLNVKNYEAGTGYAFDEANDRIVGGELAYQYKRYVKVSGFGAFISPVKSAASQSEVLNYGAALELPRPVPWASVYLEAAKLHRNNKGASDDDGKGLYGAASFYLGAVTLLAEGKAYDNLFEITPRGQATATNPDVTQTRWGINQLIAQPTAERAQAQLETNRSVYGGRLRADYSITPLLVPYLSLGAYVDDVHKTDIFAGFGGLRYRPQGFQLVGELGHRRELLKTGSQVFRADSHVDLDLRWDFIAKQQAELVVNLQYSEMADADWVEGRVALSWTHQVGVGLTAAYEVYTRQPTIFDEHYFSLSGQWQFMPGSILRAMVGGERAGLKCAGGVCRLFPGFEGGRLELELRL